MRKNPLRDQSKYFFPTIVEYILVMYRKWRIYRHDRTKSYGMLPGSDFDVVEFHANQCSSAHVGQKLRFLRRSSCSDSGMECDCAIGAQIYPCAHNPYTDAQTPFQL